MSSEKSGLVSVIIPCFNQGHYLGNALKSLENSTYDHIEVTVIDDGSTDPVTQRIIEDLVGIKIKGKEVNFKRQDNRGLPATRNVGIRDSQGEYILALDADDEVDPTYIEKCIWVLTRYPDVSIVYSSVQHFGTQNDVWYSRPYDYGVLLLDNYMLAGSVYRRTVWDEVGGYDECMNAYEDWDFWIRAGSMGYIGYWLPEALFRYRKSASSMLVSAHKRREQLIQFIRQKNSSIYRQWFGAHGNGAMAPENYVQVLSRALMPFAYRIRLQLYKKFGAQYKSIKNRTRKWVKPAIKRIYRDPERLHSLFRQYPSLTEVRYRENNGYACAMDNNRNRVEYSILLIVPWLQTGGVDRVHLQLVRDLTQRGISVHLFTTESTEHPWESLFKEHTPHITHLGNWFNETNELVAYVLDYLRAHKLDVVQVSNSRLGYRIIELIRAQSGSVATLDLLHSEAPHEPWDYFRYSEPFKHVLDARIVLTPAQRERLITNHGEMPARVRVIPNGVTVPRTYEDTQYESKAISEPIVIAYVGRLAEEKQPLEFVRVAKGISCELPGVRFVMLGDGPLKRNILREVERLGLSDKIQLLGARNDVLDILREKIQILVAPSKYEGLPMVGLECMSLGIPIVATDVSGWRDLIEDGHEGYLVPLDHIESICSHCDTLIHDVERRLAFSRACYDKARRFYNIDKTTTMYVTLHEELLTNRANC